jgi:hypothetical protein
MYRTPELTYVNKKERGHKTICYIPMVSPFRGPLLLRNQEFDFMLKENVA